MKNTLLLLTTAFVGIAFPTHATVVFQNTGTTSGWSYTSHDGVGTVTQVSSPVYKGSTSLRCWQQFQGGDTTLHSEAVIRDVGKNGWNRYYGWAVYIPSNWTYSTPGCALSQLAADTSCGGQQTDMIQIYNSRLEVKNEWVDPCNPTRNTSTLIDPYTRGVWHRIVIHKLWSSSNTGVYEIWLDGTRRLNRQNTPNSFVGSELYRWSIGLYAGFSSSAPVGSTRTVHIDHARVTSSYNEADPAQW